MSERAGWQAEVAEFKKWTRVFGGFTPRPLSWKPDECVRCGAPAPMGFDAHIPACAACAKIVEAAS